jgi:rRNA processing protein Gar1
VKSEERLYVAAEEVEKKKKKKKREKAGYPARHFR